MTTFFDDTHIRQILQSINIIDIVSHYVALRRRGKEMVGLCPFHDDKNPSMYVSEQKQLFKCFSCGAGGDAIKFMMLREKMSFPEAVEVLADRVGIKLPQRKRQEDAVDRNELERINRWAARHFRKNFEEAQKGQKARDYVAGRNISEESSRKFGLGYAPDSWDDLTQTAARDQIPLSILAHLGLVVEKSQGGYYDRFRDRLIFPVLDPLGRVIGFGGRTLGDDPAKYLNSPESALFDKSRTLYGLHGAKDTISREHKAIIVEGYTDCIMAHQFGLTNVVATLGTALTTEHARGLSRYAEQLILIFDSDEAGQKAADRAIEVLFKQQIEVKMVSLPIGMDPCDFLLNNGAEAFAQLASRAVDALEYKWDCIEKQLQETDSVAGHKRLAEDFLRIMATYVKESGRDNISLGYIVNRIAKMLKMPAEQVQQRLKTARSRRNDTTTCESRSVKLDARGRCEQEIIEVLLNRPELFGVAREVMPKADYFQEPTVLPIARRLWHCYENDSTTLTEIIGGFESVELSRRVIDLAENGSRRGDLEQTLLGALTYIRQSQDDNSRRELSSLIVQARDKYGDDGEAALLQEIQAKQRDDKRRFPMIGTS